MIFKISLVLCLISNLVHMKPSSSSSDSFKFSDSSSSSSQGDSSHSNSKESYSWKKIIFILYFLKLKYLNIENHRNNELESIFSKNWDSSAAKKFKESIS